MKEDIRPINKSRLYYLDNVRVALVILVVLHHIAVVYGAAAPFYYVEPPFLDGRAYKVFLVFVLINQSFFMGTFFFLSGYLTPGSFDRKGPAVFLKDKLLRLGIPIVVFAFLLNPISSLGYYLMPEFLSGITAQITLSDYPGLIGLGPLWFAAMLLIFNFGYAAWRRVTRNRLKTSTRTTSGIGYVGSLLFIIALAIVSYLFRMIVPLGKSVLDFPTLAYLPQYLSFFIIGIVSKKRNWLETLTGAKGLVGFSVAIVSTAVLFPLAFSGEMFSLKVTPILNNAMGSGHWQSGVYALWDSLFSVGFTMALIVFFRRWSNNQRSFGAFLSRHSFAVYILHTPIVVFLAYAMRRIDVSNLAKFGLATAVILPSCFIVAFAVRYIPGASNIL